MNDSVLLPSRKEESEQGRALNAHSSETGAARSQAPPLALQTLPAMLGNRWAQRVLAPLVIQPKLTIGAPDDVYEKEADEVAEQVMSAQTSLAAAGASGSDDDHNDPHSLAGQAACQRSAQRSMLRRIPIRTLQQNLGNRALARFLQQTLSAPAVPELSRKCACGGDTKDECAECRKKRLDLHRSSASTDDVGLEAPPIVEDVLATPGQPLAQSARRTLEPGFGHEFSGVRVHDDSRAAESASAVDALAYTEGNHIVFGAGQYAPDTQGGNRLLAHELTHTIQQTGGTPTSIQHFSWDDVTGPVSDVGQAVEQGAEAVGSAVTSGAEAASEAVSSGASAIGQAVASGAQAVAEGAQAAGQAALQRRAAGGEAGSEAPPVVEEVLAMPGQPLAESARRTLEPSFGYDFSDVRVHDDARAAESASSVSALAYTAGNHIVFNSGQYAPGTTAANPLLAHELTHTIRQRGGAVLGSNMARLPQTEGNQVQRDSDSPDQTDGPTGSSANQPAVPAPASPDQTPDDLEPVSLEPLTVKAESQGPTVEGGCDGLSLHGQTTPTFKRNSTVEHQRTSRGQGCGCASGVQCIHVTGTRVTNYSVSVAISMPSVPGGLTPCERGKVQDFLNNVLRPHELDHKARFETYNGQTRNPLDITGCGQADLNSQIGAIQDAENTPRQAAAQALSDAIDPFVRTIDCSDCQQRSTAPSSGQGAGPETPIATKRVTSCCDVDPEAPSIVEEVLGTPGQPLAQSARRTLEPSFGHDFSQVRVHDDSKAAESAASVSALAYTVGNHIVFNSGQYAPGTTSGNRLLAHELTHTIQQTGEVSKDAASTVQRDLLDSIGNAAGAAWNDVSQAAGNVAGAVSSAVDDAASTVASTVSDAAAAVSSTVSSAAGAVSSPECLRNRLPG